MEELFPLVNEQGELVGKATRAYCHSGTFVLHPVVHLHVFNSAGQLFLQKRSFSKDIQPGMWDTSVGGHVDYTEVLQGIGTRLDAGDAGDAPDEADAVGTLDAPDALGELDAPDALGSEPPGSEPPGDSTEVPEGADIAPWVLTALRREACEELGIMDFKPVFVMRYSFRSPYECELVHTFFTIHDAPLHPDPVEISEGRFWDPADILASLGKGLFTPNFEGEIREVLIKSAVALSLPQ